ncbi:MAG: VOC family protein [Actinomycetota bacterium]|nr:VOC family protein [Actinomycetota bacterium]
MLDHVGLEVSDLAASRAFYVAALEPLGLAPIMEFGGACGMGTDGKPGFSITSRGRDTSTDVHVAITAPDSATVDRFHEAALAVGGRDNGGPGVREIYHSSYYGAFVLDPDGNNIEAVTHRPE